MRARTLDVDEQSLRNDIGWVLSHLFPHVYDRPADVFKRVDSDAADLARNERLVGGHAVMLDPRGHDA